MNFLGGEDKEYIFPVKNKQKKMLKIRAILYNWNTGDYMEAVFFFNKRSK